MARKQQSWGKRLLDSSVFALFSRIPASSSKEWETQSRPKKTLSGTAAICRTEEARAAKKEEKTIYDPLGFTERLTLAGYFPEAKDFDPYIEGSVTWDNAGL